MKIIRNDIEIEIYFDELTIGDVFKYENTIFLKTESIINYEGETGNYNAVELESGYYQWFNDGDLIYKIDCQLIIE